MNLKGKVSSIEPSGVRIILVDRNNSVTVPLQVALHVGSLDVGDNVAVMFYSSNLNDGLIIAKY